MQAYCRSLLEMLALFFASLLVFSWGLSGQEIIRFESRFYLFALEMWRDGVHFFPTIYGEPYPDYLATVIWLIELIRGTVGHLDKFVAVLPTAMAAAFTVTLTYFIGALQNKRWGLYAFFFCFLTLAFLKNARSISLDMFVAMVTTACFYLVMSADVLQRPQRVWGIYILLLIGFLFRGPIGLVVPTGVLCTYYFLDLRIKKMLQVGFISLFLLIASMLLVLWLALHVGGEAFMHRVWEMQVFSRVGSGVLPFYYYLIEGLGNLALSFPLALLTLLGLLYYALINKKLFPASSVFLLKLTGWILVVLIGFSLAGDKKIRYLLPLVPAAALLTAYIFVAPPPLRYFARLRVILLMVFWVLPGLFVLALWLKQQQLSSVLPSLSLMPYALIFAGLQLFNIGIGYFFRHQVMTARLSIVAVAVLCMVLAEIKLIEPIDLSVNRTAAFVSQIEMKRKSAHAHLAFYKEELDGLPIKYIVNMKDRERPLFIETPEALNSYKGPAYFVTREAYFAHIPPIIAATFYVIAKGSLGHVPVVVFKRAYSSYLG